jgi:hypothetical protein
MAKRFAVIFIIVILSTILIVIVNIILEYNGRSSSSLMKGIDLPDKNKVMLSPEQPAINAVREDTTSQQKIEEDFTDKPLAN